MASGAGEAFPMAWPRSLWAETARPLDGPSGPLEGEAGADVAIVGAGYTGLAAALRLAERGLDVVVLDANAVGWGASGRNGGVVSTKFRVALPGVARSHGIGTARRLYEIGHEAVAEVERLVETHAIADADFRLCGNLRCAHTGHMMGTLKAEAQIMRDQFGDRSIRILDKGEIATETGSHDFVGGLLSTHSGTIHPLNYARGLARAALGNGVRIFEGTPALSTRREGAHVVVQTPKGRVKARHLLLATNGYSDLTGASAPVRRAVVPFRSAMVATEPLGPNLFGTLMSERRSYSETRRMMRWFRPFGNRMIFGGRGAFGKTDSRAAFDALERAMLRAFPQLEGTAITHRWSGLVAMTFDSLPQVGPLDERTVFALGYNGTGIAMSSYLGGRAADLLLGDAPDLPLILTDAPRTIPFYAVREPAVRVVAGWYQFLDAIGR